MTSYPKRKNGKREWPLNFLAFKVSWQCICVSRLQLCCNMNEESAFEKLQRIGIEEV
jgi:hypothetical protein